MIVPGAGIPARAASRSGGERPKTESVIVPPGPESPRASGTGRDGDDAPRGRPESPRASGTGRDGDDAPRGRPESPRASGTGRDGTTRRLVTGIRARVPDAAGGRIGRPRGMDPNA